MGSLDLVPPSIRDLRATGWAAALDVAIDVDARLASPILAIQILPEAALPYLAEQMGVGGALWAAMPSTQAKRDLLEVALKLQRFRGTPWAVGEVLRRLGYADAQVLDRQSALRYDGEALFNGDYLFDGQVQDWAHYKVRITPRTHTVSAADLATALTVVQDWAPLRSRFQAWEVWLSRTLSVTDPATASAAVALVALGTAGWGQAITVTPYVQARPGGVYRVRAWVQPDAMTLNIGEVALLARDGSRLAAWSLPQIDAGVRLDVAIDYTEAS